jgi:hypothetical protein
VDYCMGGWARCRGSVHLRQWRGGRGATVLLADGRPEAKRGGSRVQQAAVTMVYFQTPIGGHVGRMGPQPRCDSDTHCQRAAGWDSR